ncbi:MAG: ammonium transporter [Paraglaciecola sp.]|uniref:ammonium transporter n=1 Tax=Paraglaciecola sp. TaxID=1920173 RepID=UPI003297934A
MLEHLWLLISTMFVFLMQVGFLCLESGRTRSKNNINVAAKNVTDFIISASVFWLFGFGLMFGPSLGGWIGGGEFLFGQHNTPYQILFFLFQMMFCSTAATLMSGAVAERMRFSGYIYITIILSAVIYPLVGHWTWASAFTENNHGWLEKLGFIDFAGATVVHSVGGWVALAAVLVIGPRLGRFQSKHAFPSGSNLPMAALGTMLIWFGWFGFNGGSALTFDELVPVIILNTCLAGIWGGLASTLLHQFTQGYVDVGSSLNGIIAGLVGVTAGCHAVSPIEAAFIGIMAGVIAHYGSILLDILEVDDALKVIPTHLFAGAWGTLAVGIFGDPLILGTGLSMIEQIVVQLTGTTAIGAFSFCVSFVLIVVLNRVHPLRVSQSDENRGLNVSEHHATTELIELLDDMQTHQIQGNYSFPVKEEPFTEVGQIAKKYNQVISQVSQEMRAREQAINQFKLSEKRKSAILDSSMDCIISIDYKGHIIEFNPAAERTLGILKNHISGLSFIENFAQDQDQELFMTSLSHQFSNANGLVLDRRSKLQLKRASGQSFPAEITITSARVSMDKRLEFTLHLRDVTQEQKIQSRLHFLAYKDPLTHLSNRTHLMRELNLAVSESKLNESVIALFFLDLDNFKKINDTLGHKAGDFLLVQVASRLNKVCGDNDVVARLGGDEFIIVAKGDLNTESICEKAQQVLTALRDVITINEKSYRIPTSIGIAISESGSVTPDELIQYADIAMYHAKTKGRDNYQLYTHSMGKKALEDGEYERRIQAALERNQLSMVYQPKVTAEGTIVSFEALIRWHHPTLGSISPAEFIPIAEQSNLIVAIGEFVIVEVLKTLKNWSQEGYQVLPVSINIAGRHLISPEFLPFIQSQLAHFNIDGKYLEIEITESMLIEDIETCVSILKELKSLNCNVSVDDFGTGYSSLSYLKILPLDILKIDRSFVAESDVKVEDAEICATIVNLAKSLKLTAIAEGIETESQLATLQKMGCEYFQGYYFHKPQSVANATKLLAQK